MRTTNPLHRLWYVPLREAAKKLRANAHMYSVFEDFCQNTSPCPYDVPRIEPDDTIQWYAYWILQRGLPLFGTAPPSRVIRYTGRMNVNKVHLRAGATEGWHPSRVDHDWGPAYNHLFVRRIDLWRMRKEINPKDLDEFFVPPQPGKTYPYPPSPPLYRRIKGWGLTRFRKARKFAIKLLERLKFPSGPR